MRHVSGHGVALVKRFEGFRSHAYTDAVGVWTIGYGETAGVGPGTGPWTERYAAQRLQHRLDHDYADAVRAALRRYKLDLDQREFDALTSLAYNLGVGIFTPGSSTGSSLRDALASRNRRRIGRAIMLYSFAGGSRLLGLVRRRAAERKLFLWRTRHLAKWRRERAVLRAFLKAHPSKHAFPKRRARLARLNHLIQTHTPKE